MTQAKAILIITLNIIIYLYSGYVIVVNEHWYVRLIFLLIFIFCFCSNVGLYIYYRYGND